MKYKLINGSLNDTSNVKETVLLNRGIEDIESFTNLDGSCLHSYELLPNIEQAVRAYIAHCERGNNIHIVVDSDTDGYCSAAIVYSYTQRYAPECRLTYSIHTRKQHGLTSDIRIPDDINLLIIPDAGSDDVEQCEELQQKGIEIIILDHHEWSGKNPHAIVVNNQGCDYPNKHLCGAGVVYKFLQAVDDETWNNMADDYIDLVSLALIGDNMDVKEPETRYLIDRGLNRINNKLYEALISRHSFNLGNRYTGKNIQFTIVPQINGMIRAGDSDEKHLLFQAFIEKDEIFKYKKSEDSEEEDEDVYTRAARLCANAKGRQDRSRDSSLFKIYDQVERLGQDKNKIIMTNVTSLLSETMTGLSAIRVAQHYNKPCILLRKEKKDPNYFGGSGRNLDNSPIPNLREFLLSLGLFKYVSGHPSAFGVSIEKNQIPKVIEKTNELLKDIDFTKFTEVDFIISDGVDINFVKDIDSIRGYYGSGFDEPLIVVENLFVDREQFQMIGKKNNTWKVIDNENITYIRFRVEEDDLLYNHFYKEDKDSATLTIIGTIGFNNFRGILSPQMVVNDYKIMQGEENVI